jgi:hypothetical protein
LIFFQENIYPNLIYFFTINIQEFYGKIFLSTKTDANSIIHLKDQKFCYYKMLLFLENKNQNQIDFSDELKINED